MRLPSCPPSRRFPEGFALSSRLPAPPPDQALLVADQLAVTFDGHLRELPASCPLLLAGDARAEPSFALLLNPDPRTFLWAGLDNHTVSVGRSGQVRLEEKKEEGGGGPPSANEAFTSPR